MPNTTNASGSGTGYTGVISGTVWSEAAVNASATRAPRQATHTTAGPAALYASGGIAVLDWIAMDSGGTTAGAAALYASGGTTASANPNGVR